MLQKLDGGVGFPRLSSWPAQPWPGIGSVHHSAAQTNAAQATRASLASKVSAVRRVSAEDLPGKSAANEAQEELSECADTML